MSNMRGALGERQVNIRKAALALLCSTFCIALCSGFIHLAGDLPALEKQFVRSSVMIILSISTVIHSKSELQVKRDFALPLVLRGLFGAIACSCNFYAIDHLPLATANMLAKLAPFFTVLFAWLFLKEKLRPVNVLALVFAFIGVLFAVRPGGGSIEPMGAVMGIASGLFGGAAFASLRACDKKGASNTVTVMSFSVGTLLFSVPTMIFSFQPISLNQILILVASGLIATAGHFCIAMAYRFAPPSKVSVFDYCQIVWSALIGFVMFGQRPGLFSLIGYAIIILTGVMVFLSSTKKNT